ncbi:IlvD/Edd family dehydratase [Actinomadura nitritigenes]|uniref:Dihydroxy-acid dehydratase n=1 Tax=Actinomadura nitritigenes TaxID=134602 RepID=A0ABS3RFF4_9ACTN|nr:dihydroxy-acid dehydratase [Actinomadura nitritigenes]MBO2444309.1 dihydroxy-acid dehydratase [Actinomadura nitritigenes]
MTGPNGAGPSGVDRGLTSYGDEGFSRFLRRAFLASSGFDADDLDRPVVGIADTSSDYTTCHREMPQLVESVKRGVLEAGGLPLVFPTMSLPEILLSPTSMLFRNLMAMETEELVRAQPMDAVVLLGGCDKTVPAQLMAAVSADIPAVQVVAGPMLTSSWQGQRLGACTDCRGMWARHRAGELDEAQIADVRSTLATTGGTCMVMGTASTMACVAEALGLSPAGTATAPAATGDRLRAGSAAGRLGVAAAKADLRPSALISEASLRNAVTVLMAIGGSTNAIIHLLAIAGRTGLELTLDDFDAIARRVPLLVDCKPSGSGYLEDLHRAGGVPVLMKTLEPLLDLSARTIEGGTLGDRLAGVEPAPSWQTTIRPLDEPLGPPRALAVLRGNLAPDGAVIKLSAATSELTVHEGPAVVFESPEDVTRRIDDPDLDVTPDSVLVLRNAGPVAAGMPEAGSFPIPKKLAQQGVRDMVRVSDARMSGTSYGTVVLHVAPEAAIGGPLALVEDGDVIRLDAAAGELTLLVPDDVLQRRRERWTPPPAPARGWRRLNAEHVLQAPQGADFDTLRPAIQGSVGAPTEGGEEE